LIFNPSKKISMVTIDDVVRHALERGFFFPTAEIYGGLAGAYEYGPMGVRLLEGIVNERRKRFVFTVDFPVYEIHGSPLLPRAVFEASGHLEKFNDPMVQCKSCKSVYRADKLIEEKLGIDAEGLSLEEIGKIIKENDIRCPRCGGELSEPRRFNLMFKTYVGPVIDESSEAYLRPETAQNIFIAFRRVVNVFGGSLPFAIAQRGEAYRNEISPRRFLIRLRVFRQMEVELFTAPEQVREFSPLERFYDRKLRVLRKEGKEEEARVRDLRGKIPDTILYYAALESELFEAIGIDPNKIRFREIPEHARPHYSSFNLDAEVELSFGRVEVAGNAYRTDYDLKRHAEHAGISMEANYGNKRIVPHVTEPSIGIERLIYAILEHNLEDDGRGRKVLRLKPSVAPYDVAVFPLVKKLRPKALEIRRMLSESGLRVRYRDKGKIGKMYAWADMIGIPLAVTVDYDTLKDGTVTIRDRDTREQERVHIRDLADRIREILKNNRS